HRGWLDQIRDLREEEATFREEVTRLDQQILAASRAEKTRDAMQAAWSAVINDKAVCANHLQRVERRSSACQHTVALLGAVEQVLGLRGVRAHVLGRALTGIEAVGNAWLAKIAGTGLQLTLKPYSEKKTGGVTDAISLEIDG